MRPRLALFLVPLLAALLAPMFVACQGEGEGMPCDPNAGNDGNDDCQSPLVCTTGLTNATGARCCPQNRATATTPECKLSSATFDGESPAPPDGSDEEEPETSTPEAASEAAVDAPTDSAGDASGDTGAASSDASDASDSGSPDAPGG
jgi:hypothetical protein